MRVLRTAKKIMTNQQIYKRLFVFDVETTKLEPQPKNFVFGVVYGYNYTRVIRTVKGFRQEFTKKKYKGCYMFAHNAEFDLSTIYGNIFKNLDSSAIFNSGKLITAKLGGLTFGDSLNIYPSKLENIGKLMNLEKLSNEKVKSNRLKKSNITKEDIDYCTRDCEIIFEALFKIFSHVGIIKLTISSLSMYDYRKNYLNMDLCFSDKVDDFYQSYYGGRTEVFQLGETNSTVYDINSLYPYAMLNCVFPSVKDLKRVEKLDKKYLLYLIQRYEGLVHLELNHKESYFGFIPVKYTNSRNETKLIFPVGKFKTTINFNELRFALKNNMVEIGKISYAVYGLPIISPFQDFVTNNYNQRKESKNDLEKLIIKLKLNSLYGKFAMRKKFTNTYYDCIPFDLISELEQTEIYHKIKLFNHERNDCFIETENIKFKNSFFAIPTYSSYITSYARIILLQNLLNNQKNGVTYCDTDSIFLEKDFIGSVGVELGQFKKENKQVKEIKGLKHYTYIDLETNQLNETLKGVSRSSIKISDNMYKKVQYYKTLESLRQNRITGSKKEVIKNITGIYDKRILLSNGQTKPITL